MTRHFAIIITIAASIILFATCMSNPVARVNNPTAHTDSYTGSAACARCHQRYYDSFQLTPHAFASRPAAKEFIKGSFQPDSNTFSFNDYSPLPASVKVAMDQKDSSFFQTAWINGIPKRTERFGVVIGSGRKAQSYLYWRGNQLLQLPISWFAATHSWANSPGFPIDQIKFNRLIPAHCLECHATNCTLLPTTATIPGPDPPAFFDRTKMLYGIGCESCHGPGSKHIVFHTQHPDEKHGKYIVNPVSLSREQRLDVCAACHSGIRKALQPAFSFLPGDTLSLFFGPPPVVDTTHTEVHGNQYGLLAASKCFRQTNQLDCGSCHDSHSDEKGNLALFSQRCMNCHAPGGIHYCKRLPAKGQDIRTNCIDCHMPVKASGLVNLMVPGKRQLAPLLVRTHLIAVFPATAHKR